MRVRVRVRDGKGICRGRFLGGKGKEEGSQVWFVTREWWAVVEGVLW